MKCGCALVGNILKQHGVLCLYNGRNLESSRLRLYNLRFAANAA
jgi:hypothetical protein